MSKINKEAQEVIKRIRQAVDNPHWDQKKVVESMKEYYRLLDVPMPKIKVAKNMVLAYKICTGAAWDAARDAARGAAGGAAWGAAWNAARGAAGGAAWDAARGAARDAARGAAGGAAWNAAWDAAWNAAGGAAWDAAWDAARGAARDAAWNAAGGAAWNAAGGAAWDAAWDAAWNAAWNAAGGAAGGAAWDAARGAAWNAAGGAAWGAAWDAAWNAARGAAGGAAWDAARGAARGAAAINTGLKDPATIKFIQIETKLLEALENGLGWFFPMRDQLVIVPFPELKLDEQERLHSENSKAVIWPDKTGFYFWHGTKVNEKIIKTPSKITKKDILKEQNAEVRRCIREKLGDEKFAKRLGIEQIHKGQRGILYRTKDKDDLKDDYLYFVKVVCPTTKRVYFLGVPEFGDADSAVAWTFGKKKSNYDPKVEA